MNNNNDRKCLTFTFESSATFCADTETFLSTDCDNSIMKTNHAHTPGVIWCMPDIYFTLGKLTTRIQHSWNIVHNITLGGTITWAKHSWNFIYNIHMITLGGNTTWAKQRQNKTNIHISISLCDHTKASTFVYFTC